MVEHIAPGRRLQLHFSVSLADGQIIDSSRHRTPAPTLVVGDGTLLPGFEDVLLGLKAGDRRSFIMPAGQGFGERNPDNLQTFLRTDFSGIELSRGTMLSFADKARSELPGVVVSLDEEHVVVDFNHPLAGRELIFEVEILHVFEAEAQPVSLQSSGGGYAH